MSAVVIYMSYCVGGVHVTYSNREKTKDFVHQQNIVYLLWSDRAVITAGGVLIAFTFALIALHAMLLEAMSPDEPQTTMLARLFGTISIEADGSIAENFTHGMSFVASILFLAAASAARSRFCLLLSILMSFAWFDDSASFHERVGEIFQELGLTLGISGLDHHTQGELAAWLIIGLILLPFAIWAILGRSERDRTILKLVALPVAVLVISASIMDLLHALFPHIRALVYLEDGGEMLAIAMIATVALFLARNTHVIINKETVFRAPHE